MFLLTVFLSGFALSLFQELLQDKGMVVLLVLCGIHKCHGSPGGMLQDRRYTAVVIIQLLRHGYSAAHRNNAF